MNRAGTGGHSWTDICTERCFSFVVLYLWQGILRKPHLDKFIALVGDIVLGAISCGDLWREKQTKEKGDIMSSANLILATQSTGLDWNYTVVQYT